MPTPPAAPSARTDASTLQEDRPRTVAHTRFWFLAFLGAILLVSLISVAIGSISIPTAEVVRILLGRGSSRMEWSTIVVQLRLPRMLTALGTGVALGASGLEMQTLFRNPLADPFILGISSGASLGVALLVLVRGSFGFELLPGMPALQNFSVVGAAALGAVAMLSMMIAFASRLRSIVVLLVLGVMMGYFTSGITSALIYFAAPANVQRFHLWGFGSFRDVSWSALPVFGACVALGAGLALVMIKQLNALLLGENYAKSLGVNLRLIRVGILASASLLAAAVTAFCGPISFLGIAAPHLARLIFRTADHRVMVPASMLIGACLALVCGIFAELPGTNIQLPINVATSIVGAPVVVSAILRLARKRGDF